MWCGGVPLGGASGIETGENRGLWRLLSPWVIRIKAAGGAPFVEAGRGAGGVRIGWGGGEGGGGGEVKRGGGGRGKKTRVKVGECIDCAIEIHIYLQS